MEQCDFAQFIEDHLPNIREPEAAVVVATARHLVAQVRGEFTAAISLPDGSEVLEYNSKVRGHVGKNKMDVPAAFELMIPVFEGGEKHAMTARLRYRITEGKLTLWVHLHRPLNVIERAIETMVREVETLSELEAWHGWEKFS